MARVPMVPARELPGLGPFRLGRAPTSGEGRVPRSLQDPPGPGPCPRGPSLLVLSLPVLVLLVPVQQDQARPGPAWDPKWPHRTEAAFPRCRSWAPGPWPEKRWGRFG
jgi:hypothetical protein